MQVSEALVEEQTVRLDRLSSPDPAVQVPTLNPKP